MSNFQSFCYLFFIGAVFGWVVELFFRRITSKKWINPGFCTGPYLPIYGFGFAALYYLTKIEYLIPIETKPYRLIVLFVLMTLVMTAFEFTAGIFMLKVFKVRLWDYSNNKGNIMGLICPLFSFFWTLLGIAYYFFANPLVIKVLSFFTENQTSLFSLGLFYGIFFVDLFHSGNIVAKIKHFAEENNVVVIYEKLKEQILVRHKRLNKKIHFFFAFKSDIPLVEHLKETVKNLDKIVKNK